MRGKWEVTDAVEKPAVGIGTATDLLALLRGMLWTVSCWCVEFTLLDELSESAPAFSVSLSLDLVDPPLVR